jgi:histidinol-phosphate/aromatic aminotransferase/cobyric acid decarboxylase-like protein
MAGPLRIELAPENGTTLAGFAPPFGSHENAYGPSERVRAVLASSSETTGNRYPRGQYDALRSRLATLHAVEEKQVLLGCGSSEILRMAATRLVADSPKRKCPIRALPTYPSLGKFARSIGGNVIDVPLEKKIFDHDLDAMLKHARKHTGASSVLERQLAATRCR